MLKMLPSLLPYWIITAVVLAAAALAWFYALLGLGLTPNEIVTASIYLTCTVAAVLTGCLIHLLRGLL